MIKTVRHYLSLIKFSHTIFAMPFALLGFFVAYKEVGGAMEHLLFIRLLLLVVLCMVFARSAAMAFNRYIDAKYDKLNPRTASREIPAGIITSSSALLFVIASSILFIVCSYYINSLCFYLSPIALFVILFYSYTKRFTPLCHVILGIGLALAPIGAYLALIPRFDILPILFSLLVLTWVSAFDILYALQDEEFDRSQGLRSIPVMLGRRNSMYLARTLHMCTAIIVIYIGYIYLKNVWYGFAALGFISLLVYQHSIVKVHDISRINLAFGTTNGIASVLYAILTLCGLFLI